MTPIVHLVITSLARNNQIISKWNIKEFTEWNDSE